LASERFKRYWIRFECDTIDTESNREQILFKPVTGSDVDTNDRIAIQNRREMCVLEQISQRSIKNHLDFEPFLRNLLHTTKRTSGDLASSVTIRQPTRGDLACRMTRLRRSLSSSQNDSENRAPRSIGPRATFIQRGFKAMRYYCPDLQALPGPIKAGMPRCPRRDTR